PGAPEQGHLGLRREPSQPFRCRPGRTLGSTRLAGQRRDRVETGQQRPAERCRPQPARMGAGGALLLTLQALDGYTAGRNATLRSQTIDKGTSMNRSYAVIWNRALGAWAGAHERARKRGKGAGAVLATSLVLASSAFAADLP